jgi:pullulanase
MPTEQMIQEHLEFLALESPLLVGYTIKNNANGDQWKTIRVYCNGDEKAIVQPLESTWIMVCSGELLDEKGLQTLSSGTVTIPARSAVILYQQ